MPDLKKGKLKDATKLKRPLPHKAVKPFVEFEEQLVAGVRQAVYKDYSRHLSLRKER